MTKIEIAAGVLAPFAAMGLRWAAIAFCEWRAAKAETDGLENWEDVFWAKMLKRLSSKQYAHARAAAAARPQPDEKEQQP